MMMPLTNCAPKLALKSSSFLSSKRLPTSLWRPKTLTSAWPVYISSICALRSPVSFHWAANIFCERFATRMTITAVIVMRVAKRSQKMFVAQWKNTGDLNAQIEEMYTGHALVKVFGRHKEVGKRFSDKNDELFRASFGAQFVSGIIMPATMFVGNLVYVAIAVAGGIMVAHGSLPIGDIQAFIQYSRQFSQ